MKKTRKISTGRITFLISIAALTFFVHSPTSMAEGGFKASVADFEAKRYSQALRGFEAFSAANRSDILSHYYIALCHQNMNHLPLALREYQWVAYYSKDSALKKKAEAGAAGIASNPALAAQSSSSPSSVSSTAPSSIAGSKPKSIYSNGRLKVIEFYTSWCGICKAFEPNFASTQSKYGSKCDFQKLDAESPSNADLVAKYGVAKYPTIIFADSSGKQINKNVGPLTTFNFAAMIDRAIAQLP